MKILISLNHFIQTSCKSYHKGVGDEDTLHEAEEQRLQPHDALSLTKPGEGE